MIDGMCTDSVGGLIGMQCREYSVLNFRDDLRADGLLCSALMIEEVVHVSLHVGEVVEHFRRREDGGNGDPLMALDVAIHTGEVKNDALRLPMSWMRIRSNESASFLPVERRPSQLAGIA